MSCLQIHIVDLAGRELPWDALGRLTALEELSLWVSAFVHLMYCSGTGPLACDNDDLHQFCFGREMDWADRSLLQRYADFCIYKCSH
eukprot:SAG22_NODE_408_length_10942_cov_6.157429_8_plen_87_part_00